MADAPIQGQPNLLLAAGLMVVVAAVNAVDTVIVRTLAADIHPFVIGFFRALFGLMIVAPWVLRRPGMLRSSYRVLHLVRAALKLFSLVAFFAAIAGAPIADVTAIAFATPIFVTVGAWLFLGEHPVARRVVAVAGGFAGILLIVGPGAADVPPALWFAVLGAVLSAIIQVMLKAMSGRDTTQTLVAWNLLLTVPLALGPALVFWTPPNGQQLLLLAIQGAVGALNMTAITRAMALAPASFVASFDFLRLPFVAILGFVFFQEVAGISTWAGAAIIFFATLFMIGPVRFWNTRGFGL